jgi:hypothetical protein
MKWFQSSIHLEEWRTENQKIPGGDYEKGPFQKTAGGSDARPAADFFDGVQCICS